MDPIPDYLSIWELAHKWHGVIPSHDNDSSVTREVRDTLLALLRSTLNSDLGVYEEFVGWMVENGEKQDPRIFVEPVEELPAEFEDMYLSGLLDRKLLDYYRVSLEGIFYWCARNGFDVPDFCIPAWAICEPKVRLTAAAKARPEAEDKAKCQEIAARKWAENPNMRIAEMARDRDIRINGNGGIYKEPTLLQWLREVAPAGIKGKPGRPRKIPVDK